MPVWLMTPSSGWSSRGCWICGLAWRSGGTWRRWFVAHGWINSGVRLRFIMYISVETVRASTSLRWLLWSTEAVRGRIGHCVYGCGTTTTIFSSGRGRPFGLPNMPIAQFNSQRIVAHKRCPFFVRFPLVKPSNLLLNWDYVELKNLYLVNDGARYVVFREINMSLKLLDTTKKK